MDNLEEKVCGNCEHWKQGNAYTNFYGTCQIGAHDIDAPAFLVLLKEDSHCLNAADGCQFEPAQWYLDSVEDGEDYAKDPAAYNGVKPGIDFPATL